MNAESTKSYKLILLSSFSCEHIVIVFIDSRFELKHI